MLHYPDPPFPSQHQPMPGTTGAMKPRPDHGETSYKGSGRLNGKKAIITGGDSGIGRAVAIAYAKEGADVLISYLDEHGDARETERLVKEAGRSRPVARRHPGSGPMPRGRRQGRIGAGRDRYPRQ
jgi:hypothetical protein